MYKMLTIEDKVRVPPSKFGLPRQEAVKSSLEDRWEGIVNKRLGVILAVVDVGKVGEGQILPGDGAVFYPAEFTVLVYIPEVHELVKGSVIDVTEFGIFIRVGPLDGMVHVSQIMDDYVSYDHKNAVFLGRESKRVLKEGDEVRARIISVSMAGNHYKIGLTTRQPGLGVIAWYDKEKVEKARKAKPEKKQEKPGKPEKAKRAKR